MLNLQDTIEGWHASLVAERDASPATLRAYGSVARAYLAAGFSELDAAGVRSYLAGLARLSSATRHQYAAALRSWGQYLSRVTGAPPIEVPRIRVAGVKAPRVLEPGHLSELLEAPPATGLGLRDRAWLHVLSGAGLRVSELCALDVGDVGAVLRVRQGKGGKDRSVPLPPSTRAALQSWIAERQKVAAPGERALFVSSQGVRLGASGVRKLLDHWCAWVGVPKCHPHALRHTYATRLLRVGADIAECSAALGHSSIATTARYLHVDETRLAAVAARLG